jgi:uncharacterized protein
VGAALELVAADWWLAGLMFLAATLYTSVGHAGASAYLALMALFSVAPGVMRPTALVLNVLAGSLATARYLGAGLFRWRTFWPFALGALPMAVVGGSIQLPTATYRPMVGVVLMIAALRLLWPRSSGGESESGTRDPPIAIAIAIGAGIGLLSGLTGTGGGIFLSPILLLLSWSDTRTASGVAALFVLCNSIAGLLGNLGAVRAIPPELPLFAAAVIAGAVLGTSLGIRMLPVAWLLRAMALVLIIAGAKLIGVY